MELLLKELVQELNAVIESGNLTPEDLTRLNNSKQRAEEALRNYRLIEKTKIKIMAVEIVKLLWDFFNG